MKNKNKTSILKRNKNLALTGAFSALTIVLGITKLGLIPIGPTASITILQIPLILICIIAGLGEGMFVGAVFGIMSLIMAAMSPSGILDPLFLDPMCSIFPRIITAVVSWLIWKVMSNVPFFPKTISAGITAFLGTLAHTMLVIGSLYIFKGEDVMALMGGVGYLALLTALSFNAILESIASTLVCIAVYAGLYINKKEKAKLTKEEK